jgi:hypothetical protein
MRKPYSIEKEKSALDLVEESFHLLRLASPGTHATYFVGTLPFILALLFFWSDMSRSPFADQRLTSAAFGLTLLFGWMKICQTIFAARIMAQLSGEPPPRWTATRLWKMTVAQMILQPFGLLLLPLSLVLLFPFGWVYAFFQNSTVLGASETAVVPLLAQAWRQARLWPTQNHGVILMLKGLSFIVLFDLLLGWAGFVFLLQSFFGIQTAFTQSHWAFLNTTFFAVIVGLLYLCMDPLVKVIYATRCFYGDSLHTGRDLKADLQNFKLSPATALAALLFLTACPAFAVEKNDATAAPRPSALESASISPAELNQSIEKVLRKREYTWRLPREKDLADKSSRENGFFKKIAEWGKAVQDGIDKFIKWLTRGKKPNMSVPGNAQHWFIVMRGLTLLLILALIFAAVWLLVKVWRRYERDHAVVLSSLASGPNPDLNDESVRADQLPEEGWLRMARELWAKGEFRLGVRALYLASLAHLAERRLLTIARFKSNREYQLELSRRAHTEPELLDLFSSNVCVFERIWYGAHAVSAELFEQFANNLERMKSRS